MLALIFIISIQINNDIIIIIKYYHILLIIPHNTSHIYYSFYNSFIEI